MCFFKKRKEEKIFSSVLLLTFDVTEKRHFWGLKNERNEWVKCKWTPPSRPVTIALVLRELFEVLILRLWFPSPCRGTLGSSRAFHDSFMPSWNSSKVFAIVSTGVNTMLLQLLSCIIQEVNWSGVWKLKMLTCDAEVWNYWCEAL